jgi:biopolymer transport protein TolQ
MDTPQASLSIVLLFQHADIVVKGVLLLLLAASVWSWTVIIEKLWQLMRASRSARPYEARATSAGGAKDFFEIEGRDASKALPRVVLAAGLAEGVLAAADESAGERRARIERAMRLALSGELRRLERRLPFLATLGSAAPFVGLFGTVWGIMRSFAGIAAANNTSLAVVAPGIAEALFATAMGLAAAIPAVVAYNKLTVDLGRLAGRMQAFISRCGALLAGLAAG